MTRERGKQRGSPSASPRTPNRGCGRPRRGRGAAGLVASKPTVSSRCCSSRPGVATRTFIPRMRCASSCRSLPPMTSPADRSCCTPRVSTSKISRRAARRRDDERPEPVRLDHRSRRAAGAAARGTRASSPPRLRRAEDVAPASVGTPRAARRRRRPLALRQPRERPPRERQLRELAPARAAAGGGAAAAAVVGAGWRRRRRLPQLSGESAISSS